MKTKPIHHIKALFDREEINEANLNELRDDTRKGVKRLVDLYDKKVQKVKELEENFQYMRQFERKFIQHDEEYIAGVDEAGRGPLAGPVVAAAVILPVDFKLIGLTDSKQLSENERNEFYETITKHAISFHVSLVDNNIIDEVNIFEATKKVMTNALHNLDTTPHIALIDAVKLENIPFPTKEIIKGDEKSIAIAAASVLAKVTRDKIMNEIDKSYPQYDFLNNKGYGTKKHLAALNEHGPTPYHRKSFGPVKQATSN